TAAARRGDDLLQPGKGPGRGLRPPARGVPGERHEGQSVKPDELRDLNVIGAFALALSDDFRGAMQELAEGNESACAALIVIGQESGLSVDRLSKILGLSQPGTVRLVDRLAADHL